METDQNQIKKHQKLTAEKTGSIYFRFLQEDGRPIFATVGGGHQKPFTAEEIEENARRLVACMNACAGISTDDLERYYTAGGGLDEAMEEASLRDHVNAVRQRDLLLAAIGNNIPDCVVEMIWQSAGVSTYHPDGDQAENLHAFAEKLIDEFRSRMPDIFDPVQGGAA